MAADFDTLIAGLSELLDTDIRLDYTNIIRLFIENKIEVQIEPEVTGEFLLIACPISELPPGKFRENILKNALRANYFIENHKSILSYTERENELILFEYLLFYQLTPQKLYDHLVILSQRAMKWLDAIESGHPFPQDGIEIPQGATGKKPSLFGFA